MSTEGMEIKKSPEEIEETDTAEPIEVKCEVIEISDDGGDLPDASTKKKQRSTKNQIDYLCRYMQQHREFAAGEYKSPQRAAQNERQWLHLKAALDKLGLQRTVEQWKTCWRDQKRKARKEGVALKANNSTGNGAHIQELSDNSAMILNTIDKKNSLGCGPTESPIGLSKTPKLAPKSAPDAVKGSAITLASTPFLVPLLPLAPRPVSKRPPQPSPAPTPPPPQPSRVPSKRRRLRVGHSQDPFLNAQLELNGLMKELIKEVRLSNRLKIEQNRLLKKCSHRQQ